MRYRHIAILTLLAFLLSASLAHAQPQTSPLAFGDVIVTSGRCFEACAEDVLAAYYEVRVVSNGGESIRMFHEGYSEGGPGLFSVVTTLELYAPAPDRVYFADWRDLVVSRDFFSTTPLRREDEGFYAIAPARGNLLASLSNIGEMLEITPDGMVVERLRKLPKGIYGMDLLADQCTLLYTNYSDARVRRFNLCTRTDEPDFVRVPHFVEKIRALPDGDVLVVTLWDVQRFTPGGVLKTSYGFGATDIALTPDGSAFWAATATAVNSANGTITRVSLLDPSDRVAVNFDLGRSYNMNLAVVGEWRAAASKPPRTRVIRRR